MASTKREGMIIPIYFSKLDTPEVQNAYRYYTEGGHRDRPPVLERLLLGTAIIKSFWPRGDDRFHRDLLSSKSRASYRTLQFYNDVYGYALEGKTTHDLFIWDSMLSHPPAVVPTDVYERTLKEVTAKLDTAAAMTVGEFTQTWASRKGGIEYSLELLRLLTQ